MANSAKPETRCPLCGADNRCAIAAGKPPESCWCYTATLNPSALSAIPAEAVNTVCICPACGGVTAQEESHER